jgi:hypothetical protein
LTICGQLQAVVQVASKPSSGSLSSFKNRQAVN